MDRPHKPSAIGVGGAFPQPTINVTARTVEASLPSGESVTVYLYGATVTSWKTADGQEQLFLSEKAHLDGSKPIRGGIPVVFPFFGPPPRHQSLPQHGFARSSPWEFLGSSSSESIGSGPNILGSVQLDFGLSPSNLAPAVRRAWPYDFALLYSVTLTEDNLQITLRVQNKDEHEREFDFAALLHTYLRVDDVRDVRVTGLGSSDKYIDKTKGGQEVNDVPDELDITAETDRVYRSRDDDPCKVVVAKKDGAKLFEIERHRLPDVVVWNPWEEKARAMSDFGPDEAYLNMLCVEPGQTQKRSLSRRAQGIVEMTIRPAYSLHRYVGGK